jgi:hypothetical protein
MGRITVTVEWILLYLVGVSLVAGLSASALQKDSIWRSF